ncbi:putative recombinase [Sphingomonas changbaiensis NBRC 104936]|uniref:Putative recombinase n=1 Tax=Sphingomonas changbaiensis NBRC 104936 TaxID=1219043 RepID=A0A0E9MQZ3_9SPHN|nr:putative recombinase [Sphingomonas changbaiensis NBRC 104936]
MPRPVRPAVGKKIIQHSLGTNEVREAAIRAAKRRYELLSEWGVIDAPSEAHRSPAERVEPTPADMRAAVVERAFLKPLDRLAELYATKGFQTDQEHRAAIAQIQTWLLRQSRDRESREAWAERADRLIEEQGWYVPANSQARADLVGMMAEAGTEALRIGAKRQEGEFSAAPTSAVVTEGLALRQRQATAGETILELFDRYSAMRLAEGRKRADTIAQDRKVIILFADFVGKDRDVRSLTKADVREWLTVLTKLPRRFSEIRGYRGLTLRQAAQKGAAEGRTPLALLTVNKYLSTVSPFLDWCCRQAYAEQNPCDGLHFDVKKGKNARPPFRAEQLNTIFRSPLFTGFAADGKEHSPGLKKADDWRYWLPIVCLFTGARIGEIAQLRLRDLERDNGTWLIHIRNEEQSGQRTKSGLSRVAPIHSRLQKLGFLAFFDRQREKANGNLEVQLWPELKPNDRGEMGGVPSRFWRDYLKRIGIKAGRDGYGAHSFRHTLADRLREAGYLDNEVAVALGHNLKTVTSGYGRIKQGTISRLKDMIESINFDDVHLDHLSGRHTSTFRLG